MNNEKEVIGRTGAVTGVETRDPKEGDPSTVYTTTPPEDRVGAKDHSEGQPLGQPDPQEVTGQFAELATRDPQAMEQRLQKPEYAGAEAAATSGASALDAVGPGVSLGTLGGGAVGVGAGDSLLGGPLVGSADQNPGYTPPSKMAPPHISEASAAHTGEAKDLESPR